MKNRNRSKQFFLITFIFTWAIWIPIALLDIGEESRSWALPLVILGAFAPSLTGIFLTLRSKNREEIRDFWNRAFYFKRIPIKWLIGITLIYPVLNIVTYIIDRLTGAAPLIIDNNTFGSVPGILGFIIFMLLGGPLAEELGWRGYILDRFQNRWSPFKSSIYLGAIWIVWHIPLFFIEGTSQNNMGLFSIEFLLWSAQTMALSVIITWVYNNTNRSTLGSVLIHFYMNSLFTIFAGEDFKLSLLHQVIMTLFHIIFASYLITKKRI